MCWGQQTRNNNIFGEFCNFINFSKTLSFLWAKFFFILLNWVSLVIQKSTQIQTNTYIWRSEDWIWRVFKFALNESIHFISWIILNIFVLYTKLKLVLKWWNCGKSTKSKKQRRASDYINIAASLRCWVRGIILHYKESA